jgi:hypothetical protein
MAFASAEGAKESRKAVSALMGLASAQGILASTSEHFDLTPGLAGKAPLARVRGGGWVPAPDVFLHNQGVVVGVEVEARSRADCYPGCTFFEYAKLPSGILVDVVAFHYARALRGEDYDAASSWGQRDMEELRQALHRGRINMISPRGGGTLLVLEPGDLYPLQLLFERISRGGNW